MYCSSGTVIKQSSLSSNFRFAPQKTDMERSPNTYPGRFTRDPALHCEIGPEAVSADPGSLCHPRKRAIRLYEAEKYFWWDSLPVPVERVSRCRKATGRPSELKKNCGLPTDKDRSIRSVITSAPSSRGRSRGPARPGRTRRENHDRSSCLPTAFLSSDFTSTNSEGAVLLHFHFTEPYFIRISPCREPFLSRLTR